MASFLTVPGCGQAGEALVESWLESAAWLERNPSEQHGRAGLRRVLREAMLEVEATASHLNEVRQEGFGYCWEVVRPTPPL